MATQSREAYSSDLTDKEWRILRPLFPETRSDEETGGAPEKYPKREIANGIPYIKPNGCKWRDLPHDLPPWDTVYHYFLLWSEDGTWKNLNDSLREKLRRKSRKKTKPTAAIVDSQSVKNVDTARVSGYDAAKQIKGIKRHVVTDTLGLVLEAVVCAANIQDRDGAKELLVKLKKEFKSLKKIFADQAYAGELIGWVESRCGYLLRIVKREGKGFSVLPKRWIVERTFGWFNKSRRLSKNYEASAQSAEAFLYVTMIHLMTKRLVRGG
jgi:putative transposase